MCQFMASFNALPGLNHGTLEALMLIVSPVRGLRPLRALRSRTINVPNPTIEIWSPSFKAAATALIIASTARAADALDKSAAFATASVSSDLFIYAVPSEGL